MSLDDIWESWEIMDERSDGGDLCGACLKPHERCMCDLWCGMCQCVTNHTTAQHMEEEDGSLDYS